MKKLIALIIVANLGWTWGYAKTRAVENVTDRRAGTETGNGGDVRVCFYHQKTKEDVERVLITNKKEKKRDDAFSETVLADIQSVQLLDLYLLSRKAGGQIVSIQGDEEQIIQDRLTHLESRTQFIHEILAAKAQIDKGGWYSAESGVIEIDDSGEPINYSNKCILLQLAYQDRLSDSITRVFYDERILALMSPLHRAAFKLHEWIYHIAVDRGYEDSRAVQDIVGMIFDESFATSLPVTVNRRIRELKLSAYEINIIDNYNVFYVRKNDFLKYLAYPAKLRIGGNEFDICKQIEVNSVITTATCQPKPITQGEFSGTLLEGGEDNLFTLDPKTGRVLGGIFEDGAKWKNYILRGYLEFYPDGKVKQGKLSEPAVIGRNTIAAGHTLKFDELGRLTHIIARAGEASKFISMQLNNGAIISCLVAHESSSVHFNPETGSVSACQVSGRTIIDGISYRDDVRFFETGSVSSGKLQVRTAIQGVTCDHESIEFYESKKIKSCILRDGQEHYAGQSQLRLSFGAGDATFYEEGGVQCARLADSFWSKTFTLQNFVWRYGSPMCFYKDGKIESGQLGKSVTTPDGRVFQDYSQVRLSPEGQIINVAN